MKKIFSILILMHTLLQSNFIFASNCSLPIQWQKLCPYMNQRVNQESEKLKINTNQTLELQTFLSSASVKLAKTQQLISVMPRTVLEIIISIKYRDMNPLDAEKISDYLVQFAKSCNFNPDKLEYFDNNTSHIIGKEWFEINYSGEGMTWQKQKEKYAAYNISNFKTYENIKRFFPVEIKLPYFNNAYGDNKCLT